MAHDRLSVTIIADVRDRNTGRIYCRYLKKNGQRCTGEALNPASEILLCSGHAIRALRSMRLTPGQYELLYKPEERVLVDAVPGFMERPHTKAETENVYYVLRGGKIKIGFTSNMADRMAVLEPDKILAVEPGGRDVERSRHRQFAHLRLHGEWFEPAKDLLAHIKEVCRVHGDARPAADYGHGRSDYPGS